MKTTFHSMLCAAVVLSAGCYSTTIRNGSATATTPSIEFDGKWHSGLIYGIAELSGPYDLSKICPSGWAEIHTETSFVNGVVQALTFGVYNPQSVTVKCQPESGAPATTDASAASDTSATTATEAPAEAPAP
jgi:hypothetical protein